MKMLWEKQTKFRNLNLLSVVAVKVDEPKVLSSGTGLTFPKQNILDSSKLND